MHLSFLLNSFIVFTKFMLCCVCKSYVQLNLLLQMTSDVVESTKSTSDSDSTGCKSQSQSQKYGLESESMDFPVDNR